MSANFTPDDIERAVASHAWNKGDPEIAGTIINSALAYASLLRSIETGEYPKVQRMWDHGSGKVWMPSPVAGTHVVVPLALFGERDTQ